MPTAYGFEEATDPHERPWRTGFFKAPIEEPVYAPDTTWMATARPTSRITAAPKGGAGLQRRSLSEMAAELRDAGDALRRLRRKSHDCRPGRRIGSHRRHLRHRRGAFHQAARGSPAGSSPDAADARAARPGRPERPFRLVSSRPETGPHRQTDAGDAARAPKPRVVRRAAIRSCITTPGPALTLQSLARRGWRTHGCKGFAIARARM